LGSHAIAAVTPRAWLKVARLVDDEGWPVARVTERYDVSWPTVKRWAVRYAAMGAAGMVDRPSRPHHHPYRTSQDAGPSNSSVREWARANGHSVSDRGRVKGAARPIQGREILTRPDRRRSIHTAARWGLGRVLGLALIFRELPETSRRDVVALAGG